MCPPHAPLPLHFVRKLALHACASMFSTSIASICIHTLPTARGCPAFLSHAQRHTANCAPVAAGDEDTDEEGHRLLNSPSSASFESNLSLDAIDEEARRSGEEASPGGDSSLSSVANPASPAPRASPGSSVGGHTTVRGMRVAHCLLTDPVRCFADGAQHEGSSLPVHSVSLLPWRLSCNVVACPAACMRFWARRHLCCEASAAL